MIDVYFLKRGGWDFPDIFLGSRLLRIGRAFAYNNHDGEYEIPNDEMFRSILGYITSGRASRERVWKDTEQAYNVIEFINLEAEYLNSNNKTTSGKLDRRAKELVFLFN